MSELTKLYTKYIELKKEIKESLPIVLKDFFINNPEVKFINWVQYTPHFNDGEPCIFNMGNPEFCLDDRINSENINGTIENLYEDDISIPDDLKYLDYFSSYSREEDIKLYGEKIYNACKQLSSELTGLESFMQEILGDHTQVIVTSEKLECREYEHD